MRTGAGLLCGALAVGAAGRAGRAEQHSGTLPPAAGARQQAARSDAVRVAGAISPAVTDAERASLTITAYDLDVHLSPGTGGLTTRVGMTVRNDGATPLARLVLQVSSSLRWESFSEVVEGRQERMPFAEEGVETDVDHTGFLAEAVVPLATPLAPGGSLALTGLYGGTLGRSSARLDRIGVAAAQASAADWDDVGPEETALRGFGEVAWYPVTGAPVFLGDGAKFFEALATTRFHQRRTTMRLRLAVEYAGEPPHTAFFRGRMERLTAHSENQDVPVAESAGIATAEFGAEALGDRVPSLFITSAPEKASEDGLLTAFTEDDAAWGDSLAGAKAAAGMLASWYGSTAPAQPVRWIDHAGQVFADGALIVGPLRRGEPQALAGGLIPALSHAWMPSRQPWVEEGLAQFFLLLWTERTAGREAAIRELQGEALPLALAESSGEAQSLVEARDAVYLRNKAAAVWWMLRAILGDEALQAALGRYRNEARGDDDGQRLQKVLEGKAGGSLQWFFADWVYADKGLPDLTIVRVTPRPLPAKGGKTAGWLVAVEVRNDGDAVAEVPVTVRSGTLTATGRVRVPGRSSASTRVLFEKAPEEVQVNDGGVPEMRNSVHTVKVSVPEQ